MSKTFTTPVRRDGDDKEESSRVNKLIRGSRGQSTTIISKPDDSTKAMNLFLRRLAGRVEVDKFDDEDLQAINPKLIASLEKMTDAQLAEVLAEMEVQKPKRKPGHPRGDAGSGVGTKRMTEAPQNISKVIRNIVKERKRRERSGQ